MENKKPGIIGKYEVVLLISAIVVAFFSVAIVTNIWNNSISATSTQALSVAKIAGNTINGEMIKKLSASPDDLDTVAYKSIKDRLTAIPEILPDVRFAYIYMQKDGKLYFAADSESVISKDYSAPGSEYQINNVEYSQPFIDGNTIITKASTDKWGTWVSILVPLKDDDTGKVNAVFALDYPASKWNNNAILQTVIFAIIVCLILALLVMVLISINNSRKLKNVNRKLENVIFGTNAGTWELDIKTGKMTINEKWAEMIGYTAKEMESMDINSWEVLTNPDDLDKAKEEILMHIKGLTNIYSFERRLKHKNGSWVWVYENGKVTNRDKNGNPLVMSGIQIDVTKQKKALEERAQLNKYMVGRELKMIELKRQINELHKDENKK